MRLKHLDLVLALLISLLNVLWVFLPANNPVVQVVRVLLALPLLLFLPGYTLTQILFYRRLPDFAFLLALWPGLSLAMAIIGGLLLNMLPVGLQATSWTLFLALLTTAFALSAGFLRGLLPGTRRAFVGYRISFYEILLLCLAVGLVLFAYVYAATGEVRQPRPGFTQLSLLPAGQTAKNCAVHIEVNNFEAKTMTYRVTMNVGTPQLHVWTPVILPTQGAWKQVVTIPPASILGSTRVDAQLYQLDAPQKPYRQVHLTLTTCRL